MSYIFIHGLGQDSSSWDEMFSFITEPIHVVCPNLFTIINNKAVTYDNLYHAFSDYCNNISEPLNLCGLWKESLELKDFYDSFIVLKMISARATIWTMQNNFLPKEYIELFS